MNNGLVRKTGNGWLTGRPSSGVRPLRSRGTGAGVRVPEPMLAAPVEGLPRGDVAYEIKWDGYRCMLGVDEGAAVLRSRRGTDLARPFADLAEAAVRDLPASVLLDGEIVIWHDGRLDFGRLQRRLGRGPAAVAREIG